MKLSLLLCLGMLVMAGCKSSPKSVAPPEKKAMALMFPDGRVEFIEGTFSRKLHEVCTDRKFMCSVNYYQNLQPIGWQAMAHEQDTDNFWTAYGRDEDAAIDALVEKLDGPPNPPHPPISEPQTGDHP